MDRGLRQLADAARLSRLSADARASVKAAFGPPPFELYPLGESAVVIRWPGPIGEEARQLVDRTMLALERLSGRRNGLAEWARAYTTITVYYDIWAFYDPASGLAPYEAVCAALRPILTEIAEAAGGPARAAVAGGAGRSGPDMDKAFLSGLPGGREDGTLATEAGLEAEARAALNGGRSGEARAVSPEVDGGRRFPEKRAADVKTIPVCFGDAYGPDLEAVARHAGLTADETVELYCAAEYTVHLIGFTPGFPYLGGLPERLACPRRSVPRAEVPAGAVGIAGEQTGIYPLAVPGGWQLIGRTPLRLFDPQREPVCLLQPGDRVRFAPVTPARYEELAAGAEAGFAPELHDV